MKIKNQDMQFNLDLQKQNKTIKNYKSKLEEMQKKARKFS